MSPALWPAIRSLASGPLKKRILLESREGYHSSCIFYHSFTLQELRRELSPFFDIDEIHPIEIRVPFFYRLFKDKVALSRHLEHVPFLNQFGEWILVKGFRPDS